MPIFNSHIREYVLPKSQALSNSSIFDLIKVYFTPRRHIYLLAALGIFFETSGRIIGIWLIKKAVDLLNNSANQSNISGIKAEYLEICLLFAITFFFLLIGTLLWRLTVMREHFFVSSHLKSTLWKRGSLFSLSKLSSNYTSGELINLASADVNNIRGIFGWLIPLLVEALLAPLMVLFFIAMINLKCALVLMVGYIIVPFPLMLISRFVNQARRIELEKLDKLYRISAQKIANIKLLKLSQTLSFWREKIKKHSVDYGLSGLKVDLLNAAQNFLSNLPNVLIFFPLILLAYSEYLAGRISLGGVVALNSYAIYLFSTTHFLFDSLVVWQGGANSLRRFLKFLQEEFDPVCEKDPTTSVDNSKKTISVVARNFSDQTSAPIAARLLTFSYEGETRRLIKFPDFDLQLGEQIGFVGSIGSGKSTLCGIFGGLLSPYEGSLKLFEREISEYSSGEISSLISFVQQRPFLFADSIRANLVLDRKISERDLWGALEVVQIADEVRALPHGIDTKLGEYGVNLSGGQKQRLTIARALLSPAPILFFDDCLSAVDQEKEEVILDNLRVLLREKAVIWCAHRSSTLKLCSRIFELN
ncbi:MAG TPA: ABC transporter ATP-binding protein [Oligoflexia bacterium]|nr:ABC transporter ATP-binding protein [Oligoflexia bacterium]HMP26669.1 ABC transporter ATP-binding protein [Oligoflexia bacterium]